MAEHRSSINMAKTQAHFKRELGTEGELILRGRTFKQHEIDQIVAITRSYYSRGRTFISIQVCKALNWRQPNGWLKDRACREVLVSLEKLGAIQLPPRKVQSPNKGNRRGKNLARLSDIVSLNTEPLDSLDLSSIEIEYVKGTAKENEWNAIVDAYHYLGFRCFVGRSMKYFIGSKGRVLGCIGFTAPSWTVGPRDKLFEILAVSRDQIREYAINNGRFLILPWVRVPNLASKALSLAIKRVVVDWREYYSIEPLFLETYVDPTRFIGTSYKAANWLRLGSTKGYKKSGSNHHNGQSKKDIYIYPVEKKLRKQISEIISTNNAVSL